MKRTTLGCAVERLRVCTKGAATPDRRNERRSTGIEIHGNATGATDSGGMQRGLGCRSKSVPMSGDAAGETACATNGESFVCIGGAGFSLPTPASGAFLHGVLNWREGSLGLILDALALS